MNGTPFGMRLDDPDQARVADLDRVAGDGRSDGRAAVHRDDLDVEQARRNSPALMAYRAEVAVWLAGAAIFIAGSS